MDEAVTPNAYGVLTHFQAWNELNKSAAVTCLVSTFHEAISRTSRQNGLFISLLGQLNIASGPQAIQLRQRATRADITDFIVIIVCPNSVIVAINWGRLEGTPSF